MRTQEGDYKKSTHKETAFDSVSSKSSSSKSGRTLRTLAELLAEETRAIIGDLPEKTSYPPSQIDMIMT